MLSQAWLHLEPPTSSPRGRAVSAPIVLVAEELSPAAIALLEPGFEVRHTDGANRAELLAALPDADAVIVRSATQIDAEALAHAPRLRVVARAGVGRSEERRVGKECRSRWSPS